MFEKTSNEGRVEPTVRKIKSRLFLFGVALALLVASSVATETALATPGSGVTQTPVASGVLPEPIRVKWMQRNGHEPGRHGGPVALTQAGEAAYTSANPEGFGNGLDVSNISIVKNVVQPGGYFGWHQHSGPSWIVVTQGTLTFYSGEDATCTGHEVSAGQAFLDPGDHTHNARNETNAPVENYVVRMLPAGGAPRIDMPDPGVCDF